MKMRKRIIAITMAAVLAAALCGCGKKAAAEPAKAASETITGMVTATFNREDYQVTKEPDYTESSEVVFSDAEDPNAYEAHITEITCRDDAIRIGIEFSNQSDKPCLVAVGDLFVNGYEISAAFRKTVEAGASESFSKTVYAYEFNAEEICQVTVNLELFEVEKKKTHYNEKPMEVIRCTAVTDKAASYEFQGRKDKDTDIVIEDNPDQKVVLIGKQFEEYYDGDEALLLYFYIENRTDNQIYYFFDDIRVNGQRAGDEETDGTWDFFCSPHKAKIEYIPYHAEKSFFERNEDFRVTAVLSTNSAEAEKSFNDKNRWVHKTIEDLFVKNINVNMVK